MDRGSIPLGSTKARLRKLNRAILFFKLVFILFQEFSVAIFAVVFVVSFFYRLNLSAKWTTDHWTSRSTIGVLSHVPLRLVSVSSLKPSPAILADPWISSRDVSPKNVLMKFKASVFTSDHS